MTPKEYIAQTEGTAIYRDVADKVVLEFTPDQLVALLEFQYEALGLASEAGEVAGKAKKLMRDLHGRPTEEWKASLRKEVEGTLWYMARICKRFGWAFEDLMAENVQIPQSRKERGTLNGSGDDR